MKRFNIFLVSVALFFLFWSIFFFQDWRVNLLQCRMVWNGIPLDSYGRTKGGAYLFLRGPDVETVPNLSGLHIHSLKIEDTKVSDLSPLKGAHLSEVSLKGSPVYDVSPLVGTGVRWINLIDTEVKYFSPLKDMQGLEGVKIPEVRIRRNLDFLRSLNIGVSSEKGTGSASNWHKKYLFMEWEEQADRSVMREKAEFRSKQGSADARLRLSTNEIKEYERYLKSKAIHRIINKGNNDSVPETITPLESAAMSKTWRLKVALQDGIEDINTIGLWGMSPLHLAVVSGPVDNVKLLLEFNADAELKTKNGKTVHDLCKRRKDAEVRKELTEILNGQQGGPAPEGTGQ